MLKFTELDQNYPEKRSTEDRRKDFAEIYENFIKNNAKDQSSRCSQCGVPYCTVHCPLHNHIPDFLKLAAEDRLEEAYQVSSSTNNMPEICGRICPQDRLCEGNCVIEQSGHGSVTIGSVEKYLTDSAFEKGWIKPLNIRKDLEKNESIGIIGAGPAGLAAAEELRKRGYQIHVYDRHDRSGGLLIYGIPNFKLEKYAVETLKINLREGKYLTIANKPAYFGLANQMEGYFNYPAPARFALISDKKSGLVFMLAGSGKNDLRRISDDMTYIRTIFSFDMMDREDYRKAKPLSINIVRASEGTTMEKLSLASPISTYALQELRILNGLYPHGEPTPGQILKIVE